MRNTANLMAIAHLLYDFLIADCVEVMQLLHSVG